MRILAVDPGEKGSGLALSDASGTIANPLQVLQHVSRPIDATVIAQLAVRTRLQPHHRRPGAGYGRQTEFFRPARGPIWRPPSAHRLNLPVVLWHEDFSTQDARQARIEIGVTAQHRRSGHLDELAATVILQSYLDAPRQGRSEAMKPKRNPAYHLLLTLLLDLRPVFVIAGVGIHLAVRKVPSVPASCIRPSRFGELSQLDYYRLSFQLLKDQDSLLLKPVSNLNGQLNSNFCDREW